MQQRRRPYAYTAQAPGHINSYLDDRMAETKGSMHCPRPLVVCRLAPTIAITIGRPGQPRIALESQDPGEGDSPSLSLSQEAKWDTQRRRLRPCDGLPSPPSDTWLSSCFLCPAAGTAARRSVVSEAFRSAPSRRLPGLAPCYAVLGACPRPLHSPIQPSRRRHLLLAALGNP